VSAAARRRRALLIATAALATALGMVVGARDGEEEPAAPAPVESAEVRCPPKVAADDRRLVGQLLMVRMEAAATESLRRAVRRGELGGVVLFPPDGTRPQATATQIDLLRREAERAGTPQPLVSIDQEGGEVERFPQLAPAHAAPDMARLAVARSAGAATGKDLARLGIDVDLAPVLDLGEPDSFIASRAFGSDPESVIASGIAFGEGLQAAGVAATAKHFPGLGLATVNTDDAATAIDATRRQLEPGLEPFAAAVDAEFELVMVANAVYPALDGRPASLSRRVVDGLLRERLGYEGVIVTDDLGAGAITGAGYDEGEAAAAAAAAGAGLILFALTDGTAARAALLRSLRRGGLERDRLIASCARITALRQRLAAGVLSAGAP
jgi:beta-N-acetylhexosaminidase